MTAPDYDSFTRSRYRGDDVALTYDARMRGISVDRVFARLERRAVLRLLTPLLSDAKPHNFVVLDVPVGTGKMLPVWTKLKASRVLGIDVSPRMMSLIPPSDAMAVDLIVADAAALPVSGRCVTFAACIRLLHRVPGDVAKGIVKGLGEITDTAMVLTYTGQPRWRRIYPFIQRLLRRSREWRLVLGPDVLAGWLAPDWRLVTDHSLTRGLSRARIALLIRDS